MTEEAVCYRCDGTRKIGVSTSTKWGDGLIMASVSAPCPKCRANEYIDWFKKREADSVKD